MQTTQLRRALLAGALFVAVLATAASGSDSATKAKSDGTTKTGDTSITNGLGSADASGDVTDPKIVREGEDPLTLTYASVAIKNNSSKRSDYFVTLAVESPDGATRIDETVVSVSGLEPGQSAVEKGMLTKDIPADAVVKVQQVQRLASS
jgi:hypothetical protein